MATIELVEITADEYFSHLQNETVVYGSMRTYRDPCEVEEGDVVRTCTLEEARHLSGSFEAGRWFKPVWKNVIPPNPYSYDADSDVGMYKQEKLF